MNVSHFIGASSAVLLAWLGVTYFHQVPHERYPKQNRPSSATAAIPLDENEEAIAANLPKNLDQH